MHVDENADCEVAIIGSGLAGLIAAWAAASAGWTVTQIAPAIGEPDGRTTALLEDSVAYLKALDLWDDIEPTAYPLKTMRIIDATNRLIRAPQVDFRSSEVGLEAFGYNIENRKFAEQLCEKLLNLPNYTKLECGLDRLDRPEARAVTLHLSNSVSVTTRTVIGADGRNSPVRESLEIETRQWRYPQIALVGNFNHTLPHHDISTEFHTETGPFTLVPLGTNRSSLVCVVDPAQAERLKAMHKNDLNQLLEERMGSILGKVRLERALRGFPLSGMVAKRFGEGPVMLVGEAAHVFPPIGAQGLNLGLRDIREAIRLVGEGLAGRLALTSLGNTYSRARTTDINTRTASVDLLNRSLLSNLLPVQLARSAGLYTLGSLSPLRRLMMREGVAPGLASRSLPLSLSERPGANPIAGAEAKSDHSA